MYLQMNPEVACHISVNYNGGDSMAYNSKRPVAEHVYQDTVVWQCTSCNSWSRKEYVLAEEPTCPLCNSEMVEEVKNIRLE